MRLPKAAGQVASATSSHHAEMDSNRRAGEVAQPVTESFPSRRQQRGACFADFCASGRSVAYQKLPPGHQLWLKPHSRFQKPGAGMSRWIAWGKQAEKASRTRCLRWYHLENMCLMGHGYHSSFCGWPLALLGSFKKWGLICGYLSRRHPGVEATSCDSGVSFWVGGFTGPAGESKMCGNLGAIFAAASGCFSSFCLCRHWSLE